MSATNQHGSNLRAIVGLVLLGVAAAVVFVGFPSAPSTPAPRQPREEPRPEFKPRRSFDSSGFQLVMANGDSWRPDSTLSEIASAWDRRGLKLLLRIESSATDTDPPELTLDHMLARILVLLYEGKSPDAYRLATAARERAAADSALDADWRYTFVYLQGLSSLRRGEDENCIMCRGESSCILPIAKAAVHVNADGSKLAVRHFTEYLEQFPDDLQARWCLNLAHMTLGEHPAGVDPKRLLRMDAYDQPEHGIGRFRDIGHLAGINRYNQAGGAIVEDFDNDGLLDLAVTTMDPTAPMAFYRNKGDGTFEDRTEPAGLLPQLGGLNCVQTDYDNDGFSDIFIIRGAWHSTPMRPTLLHNNGNGTFTDVTAAAGFGTPVNSIAACWADFDNDGFLDLFVCCETSANLLYRNKGNGTFEEVASRAGVAGERGLVCKGANWIDFDNDDYPDLYLNHLNGAGRLFQNNRNGTFTDATARLGLEGPVQGFSCWSWDYDNDGFLDIFANSYARAPGEVVKTLSGDSTNMPGSSLFRNRGGKGFTNVAPNLGLDKPFVAMGSNFADLDNDGWLDFYLGTGDPNIDMLVPNRMLRNLGGNRFADISACSGTAHLQKGHGVAIADWNRDGTNDIFIEMGGAIPGDRYHNVLFQNPGSANRWINLKLVGKKTNRAAIGARIKIVTAGPNPRTIHRHITTGSSFGANPFEQLIGIGAAEGIATLEVHWPVSGTTQVFRDLKPNQALRIVEFENQPQPREYRPIPLPAKN